MKKKHKILTTILTILMLVVVSVSIVACDLVIYEPEPHDPSDNGGGGGTSDLPEAERFTFQYFTNGGTPIENVIIIEGAVIPTPKTTRDGYDFAGWWLSEDCATRPLLTNERVNKDTPLELYAKWVETRPVEPPPVEEETSTIFFNSNGGSAVEPITGVVGSKINISTPEPTKSNFIFAGWAANASLTINFDFASEKFQTTDITLYAKWVDVKYTVTFNTGEGGTIINPTSKKVGELVTAPINPIKNGYDFSGWFNAPQGTEGASAIELPFIMGNQDISLYAYYTAKNYTITYDTLGGMPVSIDPLTQPADANIAAFKPIDPTKSGYKFIGWSQNKAGTQMFTFDKMPTMNMMLFAIWDEQDKVIDIALSASDITGTLYPSDDAAWEEVYTTLTATATAVGEQSGFVYVDCVLTIKDIKVTLSNGETETLSDMQPNLLTISYEPIKLYNGVTTSIKVNFTMSADADIRYQGASFEITLQLRATTVHTDSGSEEEIPKLDIDIK